MAGTSFLGTEDHCVAGVQSVAARIATAASNAAEQAALESADKALSVAKENMPDAAERLRAIAADILSRTELIQKETSRFLAVMHGVGN